MPNEQNNDILRKYVLSSQNYSKTTAITNQYLEEIKTIFLFHYPEAEKEIETIFKEISNDFIKSVTSANKYDLTLIKLKNQWLKIVRDNCGNLSLNIFTKLLKQHFSDIEKAVEKRRIETNAKIIEDIELDEVPLTKLAPHATIELDKQQTALEISYKNLQKLSNVLLFAYKDSKDLIYTEIETIFDDILNTIESNKKDSLTLANLKNQWIIEETEKQKQLIKENNISSFDNFQTVWTEHFLSLKTEEEQINQEKPVINHQDIISGPESKATETKTDKNNNEKEEVSLTELARATLELDKQQTEAIETSKKNLQKLTKVLFFSYNNSTDLIHKEIKTIFDDIIKTIKSNETYSLTLTNLKNNWIAKEIEKQKQLLKENNVPSFANFQTSWIKHFLSLEAVVISLKQEKLVINLQDTISESASTTSLSEYKRDIIKARLNLELNPFPLHCSEPITISEEESILPPTPNQAKVKTDKNNNKTEEVLSACSAL